MTWAIVTSAPVGSLIEPDMVPPSTCAFKEAEELTNRKADQVDKIERTRLWTSTWILLRAEQKTLTAGIASVAMILCSQKPNRRT